MREESLLCQLQRRFKATTDSAHSFVDRYPNLLKDALVDGPDRGWITDITYREASLKLLLPGCHTGHLLPPLRWLVGIHTRLTLSALEIHLKRVRGKSGAGIMCKDQSMARVGNHYENARVESFFRTLKVEEVYLKEWQDFEEAQERT